jgi:hypothetical protein
VTIRQCRSGGRAITEDFRELEEDFLRITAASVLCVATTVDPRVEKQRV